MILSTNQKILYGLLTFILCYLQAVLWFDQDGIVDLLAVRKKLFIQDASNQHLKQSNMLLADRIKQFQDNSEITAAVARTKLGMIKKDEIFYQFIN